eukprot:gene7297-7873_t
MIEEEFRPKKLIVLSELTTREKEKYYQFLLLNQSRFIRDDQGRYIANIRLLAPGIRKIDVLTTSEQKKKKENASNYALVFQERLTKLRTNGFISVNVSGIQQHNYDFQYNNYPRFVSLIAFQNETVRPKLRPLNWVMKHIEDIYDHRFAHEKHDVEREEDMSSFDLILLIFPIFVCRRLGTNVGLKSLVDQTCWDLLFSADYYRNDYLECELFARFLQEFYDHNDLLFYLYVRSVIAKSLHVNFKNRWTMNSGVGRQPQSLWMSYREALHITGIVFGKDNREMIRDFMYMITPQMVGNVTDTTDSRRIDITEYLHLSVVGYHQSQSRQQASGGGGGDTERYLVPLPGQSAPIEPVPRLPSKTYATNEEVHQQDESYQDDENFYPPQQQVSRHSKGHVLGSGGSGVGRSADSFDLDEEERGYEAEYKANLYGRGPPQNNAFDEVQNLPMSEQFYGDDNGGDAVYNEGLGGGSGSGALNAFEQLQNSREEEFMNQLCYPLQDAPPDVYDYVTSTLRERLHQTVNMILADKEITDLESLDESLLEILVLEQLRVDMELLRDQLIQGLMPTNNRKTSK